MKCIRYIRPTAQSTEDQQRKATDKWGPFAIDIVEGDEQRTFDTALKILKPGNGLVIERLSTLGRRKDTVCACIEAVAAKGAIIIEADGYETTPEQAPAVIRGVMSKGITVRGDEVKPRIAHNRTDDATRKEAQRLWTQKQFVRLTNKDISEAVGVSVWTLQNWFGKRSDYVKTGPGRPKQRKR